MSETKSTLKATAVEFAFNPEASSFNFNPTAVAYNPPTAAAAATPTPTPSTKFTKPSTSSTSTSPTSLTATRPSKSRQWADATDSDLLPPPPTTTTTTSATTTTNTTTTTTVRRKPGAWIPPSSRGKTPKDPAQQATALLNKLTVEKFVSIVPKLVAVMTKKEVIDTVINVLLNKVELDQHFLALYSKLALALCTTNTAPKMNHYFVQTLLNTVQLRFNQDDPKLPTTFSKRKRAEQMEVYEKNNLKALGLIKYIGQLFVVGLVPEIVVHDCIVQLMGVQPYIDGMTAVNVTKMIELLRIVGKTLDTVDFNYVASKNASKQWLGTYMETLRLITSPHGPGNGIRQPEARNGKEQGTTTSSTSSTSDTKEDSTTATTTTTASTTTTKNKNSPGSDRQFRKVTGLSLASLDQQVTAANEKLANEIPVRLPVRLAFNVEDLYELKNNNWVPRRKKESAKTLLEVRQERDEDELMLFEKVRNKKGTQQTNTRSLTCFVAVGGAD